MAWVSDRGSDVTRFKIISVGINELRADVQKIHEKRYNF